MALRKEKEASELGLGVGVFAAKAMDRKSKELAREFRVSPQKGVRHRTTVLKKQQARQKREDRLLAAQYDPRVKGLQGVKGVTVDEDGTIGLKALREQRPDLFDMKPTPVKGAPTSSIARKIHEAIKARGGKDRYGHQFDD
jgi:hypothetical protein